MQSAYRTSGKKKTTKQNKKKKITKKQLGHASKNKIQIDIKITWVCQFYALWVLSDFFPQC
jgi:hypothetical protein